VHFYQDDDSLRRVVVDFLADGLRAGQPVVSIATERHTELFAAGLSERGFDVTAGQATGILQLLDARHVLDQVMAGDGADDERFRMVAGSTLERVGGRRRLVRTYGEMVDVLCSEGQVASAMRLEKSWNALAATFHIALLCGYAVGHFMRGEHSAAFEDVCGEHHHVIPADRRFTPLTPPVSARCSTQSSSSGPSIA
jgi:hypothetical protein